jgi:hypothetical protein
MKHLLNSSFRASLLKNSLIQFVWWIIFFPGFFSGDSFTAVQMAKSGELGNSFTASWALYVRIFSFYGNAIALLTLINGLVLVYSVTRLGYAIFSAKTAAITTSLLTLTPVVSGMGITLWHDILMSAGMLLFASFFINMRKSEESTYKLISLQLLPGSFLIAFRPNGLPTITLFLILYCLYLFMRKKEYFFLTIKFGLLSIFLSAFTSILTSNIILGSNSINGYFAQDWMRSDISCFASTPLGNGFVEEEMPGVGSTLTWSSPEACTFLSKAKVSQEQKVESQKYVPRAWLKILERDPGFLLKLHLNRNAYLVPFPINGIPVPPFLHSNIEFEGQGIEWAFPSVAENMRFLIRAWNAARGITAWAGLWVLVLLVVAIIRKSQSLFFLASLSVALMSILFVTASIPDGRYVLFVLISGQLCFLGILTESICLHKQRRDLPRLENL